MDTRRRREILLKSAHRRGERRVGNLRIGPPVGRPGPTIEDAIGHQEDDIGLQRERRFQGRLMAKEDLLCQNRRVPPEVPGYPGSGGRPVGRGGRGEE